MDSKKKKKNQGLLPMTALTVLPPVGLCYKITHTVIMGTAATVLSRKSHSDLEWHWPEWEWGGDGYRRT